jgi:hypothetical protein
MNEERSANQIILCVSQTNLKGPHRFLTPKLHKNPQKSRDSIGVRVLGERFGKGWWHGFLHYYLIGHGDHDVIQ